MLVFLPRGSHCDQALWYLPAGLSETLAVNPHCVQRGLSHGGSVARVEGGRGSRSERECLFGWLRSMSASVSILQPHLGATSQEHSLFVCMSIFLSLFVPFSLSLPPRLGLLSLSVFCVRLLSQAVHPLTSSFHGPASFLCFLVVPLLQGLYVTSTCCSPDCCYEIDSVSGYPDSMFLGKMIQ